jgi:phosphoribosylglycinamide formyltransferase-1
MPAKKAILNGEQFLHSTTHIVTEELDAGPLLLISKGLKVELPDGTTLEDLRNNGKLLDDVAKEHQSRLKEIGDWKILPLTLHWIADGRFCLDDNSVYFDGNRLLDGYRL